VRVEMVRENKGLYLSYQKGMSFVKKKDMDLQAQICNYAPAYL